MAWELWLPLVPGGNRLAAGDRHESGGVELGTPGGGHRGSGRGLGAVVDPDPEEGTTMTQNTMTLRTLLEKTSDADLRCEMHLAQVSF